MGAQVMAIGDGENDLEMLQIAGVGVAMANGAPKTLAVADFITVRAFRSFCNTNSPS
jgi:P-type E1-E2 ATPase